MKIVDLKTFLSLPNNVLYQKISMEKGYPDWLQDLAIRREPCNGNDWFYSEVSNPAMRDSVNSQSCQRLSEVASNDLGRFSDFSVDYASNGRDALFEDNSLFAVYEKEDVQELIDELKKCL